MRTFKFYFSLSNFPIHNTVLLTMSLRSISHLQHLIILYFKFCIFWLPSPILLIPDPLFPVYSSHQLILCIYEVCFFLRFHIYMRLYNYIVFVFLCLTAFIWHNPLKVHPCCHKRQVFLLFSGWVIYIVCMCTTSQSIHPRLLSSFTVVNNATVNMEMQVSFQVSAFISFR